MTRDSRTIRVVIADDQRLVRDGLQMMLSMLDGVQVVAIAADGDEAIAAAAAHDPDVVLMDLRMPRTDGVTATRRIRTEFPRTEVVVLTTFAEDTEIFGALRAGARGYLTKDASAEEIARALERVVRGGADLTPDVQRRLLEHLPLSADVFDGEAPDGLTEREVDVLRLVARGLSNTDIAAALVLSQATVKTHINHVFAKTGVRDRAQAVAYAYRRGLMS
ncbi:response regulator transcription factor [Actinoplanes sp. NPDC048791]|uniref:response regulator transcription factor n=1 Tax=Actinoplanes sp. NPDC048791 TaxID=3154623 RepID=UPI0033DEC57B